MTAPTCVLLYGSDPLLSEIRSVLGVDDLQVCCAETFSDLVELPPETNLDVLVLCDSISRREAERIKIFASARWPRLRSVGLSAQERPSTPAALSKVYGALSSFESRAA